ncbi:MAG: pirin family protein [Cyclobacteriaceae bacterium]
MRSIKHIHQAVSDPIGELDTFRAMPTRSIPHLDPFLFVNHHGPTTYRPGNQGLPFGPHPHRGFETLTYIFKGDIVHQDTQGFKSKIEAGGIQWMTAGSGLLHSEVSSEEFKAHGGEEEVIQLWMNLPSRLKMTEPNYVGLSKNEITHFSEDDGKVTIHLISGEWKGHTGPIESLTGLTMTSVDLKEGGSFTVDIPSSDQTLFYVVSGSVEVNGTNAKMRQMVEFAMSGERLEVIAQANSRLILGHGAPFNEPIVAHGPFVMNSEAELRQAFQDYQSGKMGVWR